MEKIKKNAACGNMAGNNKIYIASTEDVQSVDFLDITTKRVNLKQGCEFAEIEAEKIEMNSQLQSLSYQHEIRCLLFGMKWKYERLFDNMSRQRWLVKVIDNNGQVWLSGSLSEPLHFTWTHKSDASASGQHVYELSFFGEMSEPICSTIL